MNLTTSQQRHVKSLADTAAAALRDAKAYGINGAYARGMAEGLIQAAKCAAYYFDLHNRHGKKFSPN